MKRFSFLLLALVLGQSCIALIFTGCAPELKDNDPEVLAWYDSLQTEVLSSKLFTAPFTFAEAKPKRTLSAIVMDYKKLAKTPSFKLETFVNENFETQTRSNWPAVSNKGDMAGYIGGCWNSVLSKKDSSGYLSSTQQPFEKYGDAYFIMRGLQAKGAFKEMRQLIEKYSAIALQQGFIPYAQRPYFQSESAMPYFTMMVQLLADVEGEKVLVEFLPSMEKEYAFWITGEDKINNEERAYARLVLSPTGVMMNRYNSAGLSPRLDYFASDKKTMDVVGKEAFRVIQQLRASSESLWPNSSRWVSDSNNPDYFATSEYLPVDLNAMFYFIEITLSRANAIKGGEDRAGFLEAKASSRVNAIQEFCWNPTLNCYQDYHFVTKKVTGTPTLAALFPIWCGMSTPDKAEQTLSYVLSQLNATAGLKNSGTTKGGRFDAPYGSASMQLVAYDCLRKIGKTTEAEALKTKWVSANQQIFSQEGKILEQIVVDDPGTSSNATYGIPTESMVGLSVLSVFMGEK